MKFHLKLQSLQSEGGLNHW